MSGVRSAGTTLSLLRTTTASRPKLSTSSSGTTWGLLNMPPSSVRSPTTWSFAGARMMSLTAPTRTPSARLRIGRSMSRFPLRMTPSSDRLDEIEVRDDHQDHDQHRDRDPKDPSSISLSLQAHPPILPTRVWRRLDALVEAGPDPASRTAAVGRFALTAVCQ